MRRTQSARRRPSWPRSSSRPDPAHVHGLSVGVDYTEDPDDPAILLFIHSSSGTRILANMHAGEARNVMHDGHVARLKVVELAPSTRDLRRNFTMDLEHHSGCPCTIDKGAHLRGARVARSLARLLTKGAP